MSTKGRWFQLHLTTVIALTLTAGLLVILNLQPQGAIGPNYGFPFQCACYANGYPYEGGPLEFSNYGYNNFFVKKDGGFYTLDLTELIWNIAIAAFILVTIAWGLEYLARRKPVPRE